MRKMRMLRKKMKALKGKKAMIVVGTALGAATLGAAGYLAHKMYRH